MEICIDIETLSTKKNAHILSIGAVVFDEVSLKETFYIAIEGSQARDVDVSTVMWWLKQSPESINAIYGDKPLIVSSIGDAIAELKRFIKNHGGDKPSIWANSPSFDCDILSNAYAAAGIDRPWKYYQERDVRTAKQLVGAPEFVGIKHYALDDAIHEARIVQRYLNLV